MGAANLFHRIRCTHAHNCILTGQTTNENFEKGRLSQNLTHHFFGTPDAAPVAALKFLQDGVHERRMTELVQLGMADNALLETGPIEEGTNLGRN
ncbi:MAG: hypothetical protein WBX11_08005 [Thiobacillaceae bacterium]